MPLGVGFVKVGVVELRVSEAPGRLGIRGSLGKMPVRAVDDQSEMPVTRLNSRADLTSFFTQLCVEIGADAYMLVAVVTGQDRPELRIIASNWIYDAIQLVGHEFIIDFTASRFTAPPGMRAGALQCSLAPDAVELLDGERAKLLDVLGHAEIIGLRLHVGKRRYIVLFSAGEANSIDSRRLPAAQLRASYALSDAPELLAAAAMQDPLSERERECLYWVSAGKTTDEVAMILGVSSNTVNSYVAHAIQKFGARNRTMAMATAIRNGII